jgi:hypothetical protein
VDFYEELPVELLIRFYNEVNKNIKKGISTKNMYYELGIIISVANRRGISLEPDLKQIVNHQTSRVSKKLEQIKGRPNSA